MTATVHYVILPLRKEDQEKLQSPVGAYPAENVISLSQAKFRRRCAEFLAVAFGDRTK